MSQEQTLVDKLKKASLPKNQEVKKIVTYFLHQAELNANQTIKEEGKGVSQNGENWEFWETMYLGSLAELLSTFLAPPGPIKDKVISWFFKNGFKPGVHW